MNAEVDTPAPTDKRQRGLRLGRLFGITVRLDWSLLIIFTLIASSLALSAFPNWHPDWPAATSWLTALAAAVLFLVSVLAHEFSHALVGRAQGISINQITLFIFGGMAEMEDTPPNARAEFLMTIVGPITSVVIGLLCWWMAGALIPDASIDLDRPQETLAALSPTATLLMWLGSINVLLALFNMVPGFPLDGGRVLRSLLWAVSGDFLRATRWASWAGQGFAWLLIACGMVMVLGGRVPFFGAGLISGIWLMFIGWFLNNAALFSYRQSEMNQLLADQTVGQLQRHDYRDVSPQLPLQQVIDDYVMRSDQRAFPVIEGNRWLGMVFLQDIKNVDPPKRERTAVEDVMLAKDQLIVVSPDAPATDALNALVKNNINQLPVVSGDRMVGMLCREDIMKWLSLHREK